MLKKLSAYALTFILSLCSFSAYSYADSTSELKEFYDTLEKASFEKSSFNYTKETLHGGMIDFKDGLVGGKIDDFDNDLQKELLVFKIQKGGEKLETPDIYGREFSSNTVVAEMYENKNSEIILADSFSVSEFLSSDAGEYEFFIKTENNQKYIAVQNISYSSCFADGLIFDTQIYSYNGTNFENKLSFFGGGSSFEFNTYYTEEIKALRELGFSTSVNQMLEGYNIVNFAKFDTNIEKIVQFASNTNITDLGDIYGYNNLEEIAIKYGIVNVSLNNFSKITEKPATIKVILNNEELEFEQPPYLDNGTTMVPMRKIFEALGAKVSFDANTKTIISTKDNVTVTLVLGYDVAEINSTPINLGVRVKSLNGISMVPLRFVSEAFGAVVEYNGIDKIINIRL